MAGIRRIPIDTEAAVLREYASGASAGILAARYGLHRKTITIIVRRNGGTVLDQRSASGRPMIESDSLAADAKALYDAGFTKQEIARNLGFCAGVVGRMLRTVGVVHFNHKIKGERHGSWKGGVVKTGNGYLAQRVPDGWPWPEMAVRAGYILQHRMVVAKHFGRALTAEETVHHINGDKTDNRIENLQVRHGKHGRGEALECASCGSMNIVARHLP